MAIALGKPIHFTKHVSFDYRWDSPSLPSYLYTANINFDVNITISADITEMYCEIPKSSINVTYTHGAETSGFLDIAIASWSSVPSGWYQTQWLGWSGRDGNNGKQTLAYEDWDKYVKSEFERVVPGSINGAIAGVAMSSGPDYFNATKINFPDSNLTHTFELNGSLPKDFNVLMGVKRHLIESSLNEWVEYVVDNSNVSLAPEDIADPYLQYYSMAIRKSNIWMSCNRDGYDNRIGFDKIRKNNDWQNSLNNFAESIEQHTFKRKSGLWVTAEPTGEYFNG